MERDGEERINIFFFNPPVSNVRYFYIKNYFFLFSVDNSFRLVFEVLETLDSHNYLLSLIKDLMWLNFLKIALLFASRPTTYDPFLFNSEDKIFLLSIFKR